MQYAPDEAMKQGKASSGAYYIRLSHFVLRLPHLSPLS